MNMKTGYTLVELMVTVTIITLLTSFGISAYGKAQSSQATRAATEIIMATLSEAQKKASSGTNDCSGGVYGGQLVTLTGSTITLDPVCGSGGTAKNISVSGVTFSGSYSFTFRPLNQGVILTGGNTNIDYSTSQGTYRIQVMPTGSIVNKGKQS